MGTLRGEDGDLHAGVPEKDRVDHSLLPQMNEQIPGSKIVLC